MRSWAPVFDGLVDSSIWEEEDHVFRVFIAMLTLKDRDHVVSMDGYKLSKRIHMPIDKVLDALKVLAGPDSRRPGQEFDGRRIEAVEDGWKVLQGEFYRRMVSRNMQLARNRRSQAAYRERKKLRGTPSPGEAAAVKAMERGDFDGAAAIAAAALPEGVSISSPSNEEAKMNMPELTTREQAQSKAPGLTQPEPAEPHTESGEWIDGVWVPD